MLEAVVSPPLFLGVQVDKRTRAYKIYTSAIDVLGRETMSTEHGYMLRAMAIMIDYATKPKKKPKRENSECPVSPQRVYRILDDECGERLALGAASGSDFARLARALNDISGISIPRIQTLAAWINSGALSFWQSPPALGHVIKHLSNWLSQAEAWAAESSRNIKFGDLIR